MKYACILTVAVASLFVSCIADALEPASAIRFHYDGRDSREFFAQWPCAVSNRTTPDETTRDETARFARKPVRTKIAESVDPRSGLKITIETTTYDEYPQVIEWLAWFENTSDRDTGRLDNVLAADIVLPTGGAPTLWHGIGENADPKVNYSSKTEPLMPDKALEFAPTQGYPSYNAFPYFKIDGATTSYTIAIGWTGQWSCSFVADAGGEVRFRAGQQTLDLCLKPGEKIRTPRITLFRYPSGTDAVNLWRRWFRNYILVREHGVPIQPKLVLDAPNGGVLYQFITEEQQIESIRKYVAKGYPCDALWIDAGWYLRKDSPKTRHGNWFLAGDWTPDPERFPRGFKPVSDELAKVGAELVLWYEPERVHRECKKLPELQAYLIPDCVLASSYRMNMASEKTVAYLSETIGRSLRDNGVTIYRQDSNGVGPLPFIEHLEKTDPKYAGRKGLAGNLYVQGYLRFWANLKQMNPRLVFDTCASGGRRNDLDTLRMGAVPLHYSDVGYTEYLEKQRYHDMLYQWFMYFKNIEGFMGNADRTAYDPFKTVVDLAPFSVVGRILANHDTPANRHYPDRFLAIREYLVNGDYYLLEGGFRDDCWTITQFHDPVKNAGCLRVLRNAKSAGATTVVRFKGLDAGTDYVLENLETGEKTTRSGGELAKNGESIALAPRSGAIYRYTPKGR